jgi:hypothetical protein
LTQIELLREAVGDSEHLRNSPTRIVILLLVALEAPNGGSDYRRHLRPRQPDAILGRDPLHFRLKVFHIVFMREARSINM